MSDDKKLIFEQQNTEETVDKNPDHWSLKLDPEDKKYIMRVLKEYKDEGKVAADLMKEFVKLHKSLKPVKEADLDFTSDIRDLGELAKGITAIFTKMITTAQTAVVNAKNTANQLVDNLKARIEELERELEKERARKIEMEIQVTEVNELIKQKEFDLKKSNKEKQKFWNMYQQEMGNANRFQRFYESAVNEVEKLKEKLDEYRVTEKENKELAKELAKREAEMEKLNSRYEALQEKYERLKIEMAEQLDEKDKKLQDLNDALKETEQRIKEIVDECKDEKQKMKLESAVERTKLEAKIEQLQEQIKTLTVDNHLSTT